MIVLLSLFKAVLIEDKADEQLKLIVVEWPAFSHFELVKVLESFDQRSVRHNAAHPIENTHKILYRNRFAPIRHA